MIELTEQQRHELVATEPEVIDPKTKQTYILVRKDVYARLKSIVDETDARLMEPLLADLDPEDWEDPSNYQEKR